MSSCLSSEEFEAHSRTVSCLSLGKNSGRLLATGGEDCRVNIWAVSKANCVMVRPGTSGTRTHQVRSAHQQAGGLSESRYQNMVTVLNWEVQTVVKLICC